MADPRRGTKQRMLISATTLLREKGARGMTIDAVLADSGAPRGSVYHHFPGGRDQLLREAAHFATDFITALIADLAVDPDSGLDRFVELWAQMLRDSDFRAGCPVVGIAVDMEADASLAERAFTAWSEQLVRIYVRDGLSQDRAAALATSTVAAVEGAIVLCRTQRSTAPLEAVREMLHAYHAALVEAPA